MSLYELTTTVKSQKTPTSEIVKTSPNVIIGKSNVLEEIPEDVKIEHSIPTVKPVSIKKIRPKNLQAKKGPVKKVSVKPSSTVSKKIVPKKVTQKNKSILTKSNLRKISEGVKKSPIDIETQTIASRKISKFMRSKRKKSRSRYIKKYCMVPGLCIAFDTNNRQKINEHFDCFTSLNYISEPIKQIGESSANGFVKEIKFTHDNYSAYAALKSTATSYSDNLVYEYIAGQYINHQCNYFPCFLETYGLFYYKSDESWKLLKENKETPINEFENALELQTTSEIDYAKACKNARDSSILLQYIHGANVLHSFISNSLDYISYQMIYQMPYLLYQIYLPLSLLAKTFTHYDLHTSNVMLYEPKKGKYIEYIYHLEDGIEVRFKCPFVVKIIDYGRCFFKWEQIDIDRNKAIEKINKVKNPALMEKERVYTSSTEIYEHICNEKECEYSKKDEKGKTHKYKCGKKYGFSWLDNPAQKTKQKYFISSSRANMSHDLRLLYIVSKTLLNKKANEFNKRRLPDEAKVSEIIAKLLGKVTYAVGLEPKQDHAGTIENESSGLPSNILNVVDAEKALRELVTDRNLVRLNNIKYENENNSLGQLHIYINGKQMEFHQNK